MPSWPRTTAAFFRRALPLPSRRRLGMFLLSSLPLAGAQAEITTDGTLGPARVLPGPAYDIQADLGRQVGGNLFHSFGAFNLAFGESATFQGPTTIQNVISRVTGGNPSHIDGFLRSAIPGADLYFVNPAGVLFGPHATLDVTGSFHVSTADYLRLGEDGRFAARLPDNSVLTSAPPAAFGFLGPHPAPITFEGSGSALAEAALGWKGITVPAGKTLSVVGGDLEVKEGLLLGILPVESRLQAPGGRVNLASVASSGEVVPTASDLQVDSFARLGNAAVRGGSVIRASGESAGEIHIRGGRFTVDGGIVVASNTGAGQGGGIDIKTSGDLVLANDGRLVANNLSTGQGPSVRTRSATLRLTKGGYMEASSYGSGRGGALDITAQDVEFSGAGAFPSGLYLSAYGEGDAGQLALAASGLLRLGEGAIIDSSTAGAGRGADITLQARDLVLTGESSQGSGSIIQARAAGEGSGGAIHLTAERLSLTEGAAISSFTEGPGRGGDVTIEAQEITLSGEDSQGRVSGLGAETFGAGAAGTIHLTTDTLSLTGGAGISTVTAGSGKGGDIAIVAKAITLAGESHQGLGSFFGAQAQGQSPGAGGGGTIQITADTLSLADGAQISTTTFGPGAAGDILVGVGNLSLSGEDSQGFVSGLFAETAGEDPGAGLGGAIRLTVDTLALTGGAEVSTASRGPGVGGDIIIEAKSVTFSGKNSQGFSSGVFTNAQGQVPGSGSGGLIVLTAEEVSLTDEAVISALTIGPGAGGDIALAVGRLSLTGGARVGSGSGAYNPATGTLEIGEGPAGNLLVQAAEDVYIAGTSPSGRPSGLFSETFGPAGADAGRIMVGTPRLVLAEGGNIGTDTAGDARGGDILLGGEVPWRGETLSLSLGRLDLSGGASITSGSGIEQGDTLRVGSGAAGTITALLQEGLFIQGAGSALTTETRGAGPGGDITLQTPVLSLTEGGRISAAGEGTGRAGTITLRAAKEIRLDQGTLTTAAAEGAGGCIVLTTPDLQMTDRSLLSASVRGGTQAGGSITVETATLHLSGASRIESSTAGAGPGGTLQVSASETLTLTDPDTGLFSNTEGPGRAGDILVAAETLTLTHGSQIAASSSASGDGGSITLQAGNLRMEEGASLFAGSTGRGRGGNIALAVRERVYLQDASISTATSEADGGDLTLTVGDWLHLRRSDLTTSVAGGAGQGGNITIDPFLVLLDKSRIIANAFGGPGGNIRIRADHFLASGDSMVQASSARSIDGQVVIESPDTDVGAGLAVLPSSFLEASALLLDPCRVVQARGQGSSLVVAGRGGVAPAPDDYLPAFHAGLRRPGSGSGQPPASPDSFPPTSAPGANRTGPSLPGTSGKVRCQGEGTLY